ncbi:MAG TPA: carboxypeptidase-like regulatory domain-containing protein [Terracidiphilus sp.]|nr:carboxypeptidase-like regulatory domain-containing protein [Terracidiphilus sp.]
MAIAGIILLVLGTGLLSLAVFFFLVAFLPTSGWDFFGRVYLPLSEFLAVSGSSAFLLGIYLVRRTRKLRQFEKAAEWNKRSLRGIVCSQTDAPISRATVDIFVKQEQGNEPVATTQTDSHGRFSADLPEGRYLLGVGAPEIGEFFLEVAISKLANNTELRIKFEPNGQRHDDRGNDH